MPDLDPAQRTALRADDAAGDADAGDKKHGDVEPVRGRVGRGGRGERVGEWWRVGGVGWVEVVGGWTGWKG